MYIKEYVFEKRRELTEMSYKLRVGVITAAQFAEYEAGLHRDLYYNDIKLTDFATYCKRLEPPRTK